MAEWFTAWLPFLVAVLVFILPGACVGLAAGVRSMSMLSLAPVLSIAVVSVTAVAAPLFGFAWGPVPVLVGTALTSIGSWIVRTLVAKNVGWQPAEIRWSYVATAASAIGLAAGSVVLLIRLARIFGSPSFVSQTADNVFHLNAVRYVLDTGDASSLALGAAAGGGPSFYPAAWHGLAALIVEVSGTSIPAGVACLNLAIGCVVWPLSMWFFCRTVFGDSTAMNIGFGVLISSFSAYPYLLVDWGVLYPNYLGIAAVPAVAGTVVLLLRNGAAASRHGVMLPWLGLVAIAGIGLSHPNSLTTLIVIVLPFLLSCVFRRSAFSSLASGTMPRPVLKILLGLLVAFGIVVAWLVLRPYPFTSFNITWPPYQSTAQAVGEALFTTHSGRGAAWATGCLVILGLFVAFTHRGFRWLAWGFLAWTLMMVAVTAWQPSVVRAFLTGGWYDDYKRIAAGLALVALPLALLGFIGLYRILASALKRLPKSNHVVEAAASVALIALPVLIIGHMGSIREAAGAAQSNYSLQPGSPIMSPDELNLYEELPDLVPPDKVIAGNPWDGSAWAYYVSGRHVLFPHVLPAMDADKTLIANSLNAAASNPEVCSAAKRLNVEYVINSDELIYLPGNPNNRNYPGLEHLDQAPGFEQIAQVGVNRLYKLVACS